MVVDRKIHNALALLYLALGPLPNDSSGVPAEFAAEHNKDEVLEGKFRDLNFSLCTKKTTEYCFQLFLPIYRY